MLSFSTAKVSQATNNNTSSNKITVQAQNFAESDINLLKKTDYKKLTSKSKSLIANSSNYYDEVLIGAETTYPSDTTISQKECVVNVYKGTESLPRASIRITRYSVESSTIPKGSIIPWYGNLADIPSDFALCDGTHGTPDLRDRFIVGAGKSYKLSNTGGEDKHVLTVNEMPKHNHQTCSLFAEVGFDVTNGGGQDAGAGKRRLAMGDNTPFGYTNYWPAITGYRGSDVAHENRPPYYALYYLMKL